MHDAIGPEVRRAIGARAVRVPDERQPLPDPAFRVGPTHDAVAQKIVADMEQQGGLPGEVSGVVYRHTKVPLTLPGVFSSPYLPRVEPNPVLPP